MADSAKERRIRYFIIFFSILLVLFGFILREINRQTAKNEQKAIVVHLSENINDPPKVVLYRQIQKSHQLILYKIDRTDQNRFTKVSTETLTEQAEELCPDRETEGIWVNNGKKWIYYNERLKKEKREPEYRLESQAPLYSIQYDKKTGGVTIFLQGEQLHFSIDPNEELLSVQTLSVEMDLWLALMDSGFKIVTKEM